MFKRVVPALAGVVFTALGLVVVFGGLEAARRYREAWNAAQGAVSAPPVPVAVMTATAGPLRSYLEALGSLEAVRQVVVAPEVGGRVTSIQFEPGALVRPGDLLVQLNDAPERGELARLRATARLAELEHARAATLLARNAASKSEVDVTRGQLEEASGSIARSEAIIAQKTVRAPFAGRLGVRKVNLGEYLQPGQPVVSLTDLDALHVNFTLPEQSLRQLAPGQAVDLTVDAYPGRVFEAAITTIEPQVFAETRTVMVQATFRNGEHLLRPGMFAAVRVVLPAEPDVVTVPETALDRTIAGDSVFIARPTGPGRSGHRAERVPVKVGRRADGRVAVLEGIAPGDFVVVSGQINLTSGTDVAITTSESLAAAGAGRPEEGRRQ
jgi:multidrug efflux system membrane fusion protein